MFTRMMLRTFLPRATQAACPAQASLDLQPLRRAVASSPRYAAWLMQSGRPDAVRQVSARQFRTVPSALKGLTSVLKEEIDYEEANYARPEEVASPPGPWKLIDSPGTSHLTLTSSHRDEQLRIEVSAEDQPDSADDALEPEEDEEVADADVEVSVIFNLHVTKGDQSLVFELESDGTYVQILHLALEPASGDTEDGFYDGPVFSELDEQLQVQFQDYLAERNVTNELGGYLLALTEDKEQREYMGWLQRVQHFIGK